MSDFERALVSPGPHPDHASELMLFGQFVGSWDLDVTWYADGRPSRREKGEWHFAWILEGRGVQDVWIVPRRADRAGPRGLYEYGTSVRFLDPAIDAWRSTWIGPMHGVVVSFLARAVANTIVLESSARGGPERLRWTFSDISSERFAWRNEVSVDEGGAWMLQQDFVCRRMTGSI